MAKKQTRRSVSIRGSTYEKIREFCETTGQSMSEFVEARISAFFDAGGKDPIVSAASRAAVRPQPKKASAKKADKGEDKEKLDFDEMQDAARFFTF